MKTFRDVQDKILETMIFIDEQCRKHGIVYYIMGGTALGAVRNGGFIPWDDDFDIFMTQDNYRKFKQVMDKLHCDKYVLQEWKTVSEYLEYAKVRMNGTTFIEECFKDRKDMHHGIYVDIMILHKCPNVLWKQKLIYLQSKFVTLYALSQRNWKAKSKVQAIVLEFLKLMPNQLIAKRCYKNIYRYDGLKANFKWCYFITPAKFKQGIFEPYMFETPVDIDFEGHKLYASKDIKKYLKYRYGDYMKLPSKEQQKATIHAMTYDTEKGFENYFEERV